MGNSNSCENAREKKPPRGGGGNEWEVVSGSGRDHDVSSSSATVCTSPVSSDDSGGGRLEFENASPLDLEKALYRQDEDEEDVSESESKVEAEANGGKSGPGAAVVPAAVPTEVIRTPQQRAILDSQKWRLRVYNSSDVTLEDHAIGEGKFGKVFRATIRPGRQLVPFSVAVKEFKCPFESKYSVQQLSGIMRLQHRNVVTVEGILDDLRFTSGNNDGSFCPKVLLPYFPEGNLLHYLSKPSNPQDYLALDVIQGCEYLHSRNVIHGNLAARNILIEKQRGKGINLTHYNAKVSDHGITQLFKVKEPGRNYVKVPNVSYLPIRWVPHELLDEDSKGLTFWSDVWSFGVVLWEMLTKGSVPYGRRADDQRVLDLIRSGQSPLTIRRPEGHPDDIIEVMKRIFVVNPEKRPQFNELKKDFLGLSLSAKSTEVEKKSRRGPVTNDPRGAALAMKKSASDQNENRGKPRATDTETQHGRRREGRCRRGSGDSETLDPLTEKLNIILTVKGKERNNEAKAPLQKEKLAPPPPPPQKFVDSKSGGPHQNSRVSMPHRGLDRGNPYTRPGSISLPSRHAAPSASSGSQAPAASGSRSTIGLFDVPIPASSMPTAPPPYTATPLPNHSAVGASNGGTGRQFEKPRSSYAVPCDKRRGRSKVDIEQEIKKREEDIERLKFQKLQQKATEITIELQTVMTQMADLKINGAAPQLQFPAALGAFERSRGPHPRRGNPHPIHRGRGSGGSRSGSRGRRDAPKLTPAAHPHSQENIF